MPTFVVVLRMPASLYIPLDAQLRLSDGQTETMVFSDRRILGGQPVPGELVAEVSLEASSLREALPIGAAAVYATTPITSFAANAHIGQPEIELAYDSTPDTNERSFFQRKIWPASSAGGLIPGRQLRPDVVGPFHSAVAAHEDVGRITAAINHYSIALSHWRPGTETLALASLWIGVENVTGAVLRQYLRRRDLTEAKLLDEWHVSRRELRPAVRQRLICQGNVDVYRESLSASDAFEHGLMGLAKIRQQARSVHVRLAGYLREAILGLLDGVPEEVQVALRSYQRPRGPLLVDNYLWAAFVGSGLPLAAPNQRHPFVEWTITPQSATPNADGSWSVSFTDNLTVRCGDTWRFQGSRREMWDASTALDDQPSSQTQ